MAPWGQRVSPPLPHRRSGHGPERDDNGRGELGRRGRGEGAHPKAPAETLGGAGPWYKNSHPNRGNSGGSHPCSPVKQI
jgi:hypothetical protein